MADYTEELEPLFDYSRVQPSIVILDDDGPDTSPVPSQKRRKISNPVVEKDDEDIKVIPTVNCEDEEDWLPPPPKVFSDAQLSEDSTIKELRLKKQELVSFAQSAADLLRSVEESAVKQISGSLQSSLDAVAEQPPKPTRDRAKIVISVQDKGGLNNFRIYMDDKFERLFKLYADKVKIEPQILVFCFDGDKISPAATPGDLGMEDNDIIEVHVKKS